MSLFSLKNFKFNRSFYCIILEQYQLGISTIATRKNSSSADDTYQICRGRRNKMSDWLPIHDLQSYIRSCVPLNEARSIIPSTFSAYKPLCWQDRETDSIRRLRKKIKQRNCPVSNKYLRPVDSRVLRSSSVCDTVFRVLRKQRQWKMFCITRKFSISIRDEARFGNKRNLPLECKFKIVQHEFWLMIS